MREGLAHTCIFARSMLWDAENQNFDYEADQTGCSTCHCKYACDSCEIGAMA